MQNEQAKPMPPLGEIKKLPTLVVHVELVRRLEVLLAEMQEIVQNLQTTPPIKKGR